MKIRNGFVSNSSSTSFVVVSYKDAPSGFFSIKDFIQAMGPYIIYEIGEDGIKFSNMRDKSVQTYGTVSSISQLKNDYASDRMRIFYSKKEAEEKLNDYQEMLKLTGKALELCTRDIVYAFDEADEKGIKRIVNNYIISTKDTIKSLDDEIKELDKKEKALSKYDDGYIAFSFTVDNWSSHIVNYIRNSGAEIIEEVNT